MRLGYVKSLDTVDNENIGNTLHISIFDMKYTNQDFHQDSSLCIFHEVE